MKFNYLVFIFTLFLGLFYLYIFYEYKNIYIRNKISYI